MLQNRARNKAVSMSYPIAELAYVALWKNTNAESDGYVTGLEPGTGFPNNRRIERKFGRVRSWRRGRVIIPRSTSPFMLRPMRWRKLPIALTRCKLGRSQLSTIGLKIRTERSSKPLGPWERFSAAGFDRPPRNICRGRKVGRSAKNLA